jgi:hypothetical protein
MKKLKLILSISLIALFFGCSENNDVDLDGIDAPSNISALTTITQDNSEMLLFAKGRVTQFEIYYGDGLLHRDL